MQRMLEVQVAAKPIEVLLPIVGQDRLDGAAKIAEEMRMRMDGRVVWNVNSTAYGGGVAEMLRSILAYVRGLGVDARWLVINGTPEFFQVTKRLHHALHGSLGDGSELGDEADAIYQRALRQNARELVKLVRPRDIVILHDPQTAGLASQLIKAGAIVIWRCHVGSDMPDGEVTKGWSFLEPYLEDVHATVFSRDNYIPECCDHGRSVVIPPSIDAFSPKNQDMDDATVGAILVHTGVLDGRDEEVSPTFVREDGSPGRVDRRAEVLRSGSAPGFDTPLLVQVSRWDPLKDPVGVIRGFTELNGSRPNDAQLVLAGPDTRGIADDPEGAVVFEEVVATWQRLSSSDRARVHLVSLPMEDVEENAAIVNALQRHASVVIQKSIHEGFGLTVTEAMWKGRPVVASAVGGIQDQIDDGVHGLLLKDPSDTYLFGEALGRLLSDAELSARLGTNARDRVREEFLVVRHLLQYADLIGRIDK